MYKASAVNKHHKIVLCGILLVLSLAAGSHLSAQVSGGCDNVALHSTPIVIAHRGASGLRPEHTLAAYHMALVQGADFIEPDVVATRDGVLITRHENVLAVVALTSSGDIEYDERRAPRVLERTTDVAERQEFADRLTVKQVDGRAVGGWFSEDFSYAEIRTLWARERLPLLRAASAAHDDRYRIPSLAEVIELVAEFQTTTSRSVGLYIETKHPTYFAREGRHLDGRVISMDLGGLIIQALVDAKFTNSARVYIQSFEIANLLALQTTMAGLDLSLPLVQLFGDVFNTRYRARPYDLAYHVSNGSDLEAIYGELTALIPGGIQASTSYAELANSAVLAYMADAYASGIGVVKYNVALTQPPFRTQLTGEIGPLVALAHAQSLQLHVYTLRAEQPFLVSEGDRRLSVVEEAAWLLCAGVDGFFIDQPAAGRAAVDDFIGRRGGLEGEAN
jgi:glycerophosphoryl diester phosphodiesterase